MDFFTQIYYTGLHIYYLECSNGEDGTKILLDATGSWKTAI